MTGRTSAEGWRPRCAAADRFERGGHAPWARAWTSDVAEGGCLDRSGDDREPGEVGGELAQQLVLRAATHDVDHVDAAHRRARPPGARSGRRPRPASRRCSGRSRRRSSTGGRPPPAMRSGMPPGGMNRSSSTSISGPPAGRAAASSSRGARSVLAPLAHRLLEEPEATDVAEEADAVVDAPLVGEVRGPRLVGEDRPGELQADERPRAAGDVGEAVVGGGHTRRPRTRCRASPPWSRARRPGPLPRTAPGGSRGGSSPGGDVQTVQDLGGPVAGPGVEQAGCRRVRHLGAQFAGEAVGEEVGQEHDVGGVRPVRAPLLGGQLVEGGEREGLQPVDARTVRREGRGRARRR